MFWMVRIRICVVGYGDQTLIYGPMSEEDAKAKAKAFRVFQDPFMYAQAELMQNPSVEEIVSDVMVRTKDHRTVTEVLQSPRNQPICAAQLT